jgi:predicted PurR-regulated permease PerM
VYFRCRKSYAAIAGYYDDRELPSVQAAYPMAIASKRESVSFEVPPVITAVIAIGALYFGQAIFIPFALALLLSFLLTSPVTWLERLKLGRALSVALVLIFTFSLIAGLLWMGTEQLSAIVVRLPEYQTNIRTKMESFSHRDGSSLARVTSSIDQIQAQLTANAESPSQPPSRASRTSAAQHSVTQPVPVEVVQQRQHGFFNSLGLLSTSLGHFFGEVGAVIILTLFILIKREHLRNRLFRLMGQEHLVTMTTALDDAARRVSRYLLTQSLVNSIYGLLLGLGLYFIGLPYAPVWGVLAAMLRFIPYAGTAAAGLCPFVLSLAVFSDWKHPLLTLGLFAAIEAVTTAVIEPWLYATRTGISSLAILLSAAFWTVLWGPIGLVVSTPLTVCLAVLGRHLPHLEFLYVLLSDEPVLSAELRFYQRLLAMDEDEAADIASAYLKEKNLTEVYESLLIPTLEQAEQDRRHGKLEPDRESFILQTMRELIEELSERSEISSATQEVAPAQASSRLSITCLPAKDEADELAGLMLAHVLRREGYHVEVIPIAGAGSVFAQLSKSRSDVVVISAVPPLAIIRARTVCRKARQECRGAKLALGLWNSAASTEKIKERLGSLCSETIFTTLGQAQSELATLASPVQALDG